MQTELTFFAWMKPQKWLSGPWNINKDPLRTQNAKKILIKDQVLKIRTLLETVVGKYLPDKSFPKRIGAPTQTKLKIHRGEGGTDMHWNLSPPLNNAKRTARMLQCTMLPLLTKSCLKSNKLRPILNGQFCHAISKNIGLNLFRSKQPREILVFVILKL